jgi:hypothetical protein
MQGENITVPTSPRKLRVFDAAALRVLEELCESTLAIIQAQHPFRDRSKDDDLRDRLRRSLFILAENSDLTDLDALQRSALEQFSRGLDIAQR